MSNDRIAKLLESRSEAIAECHRAEAGLQAIHEQLVAQMESSKLAACISALRWLYLRDGERGAASACMDVVEALAPWLAQIAKDDAAEAFRIVDPEEATS